MNPYARITLQLLRWAVLTSEVIIMTWIALSAFRGTTPYLLLFQALLLALLHIVQTDLYSALGLTPDVAKPRDRLIYWLILSAVLLGAAYFLLFRQ